MGGWVGTIFCVSESCCCTSVSCVILGGDVGESREGVGVNLARIVLVFNGQYREIVIIQHSLSLRFDRVAVRANLLFLIGQLLL